MDIKNKKPILDNHEIKKLIAGGENQFVDFKFQITNARKIARSMVAFANTDGGKLLIGVKDNGNIVGISSDEELYMIELAAFKYCKPAVKFEVESYDFDGKIVLQVSIDESTEKPHYSFEENKKWLVYVRKNDENILSNKIWIEVLKRKSKDKKTIIKFNEPEKALFKYLESESFITLDKFIEIAKIKSYLAEKILINFLSIDVLSQQIEKNEYYYSIKKKPTELLEKYL